MILGNNGLILFCGNKLYRHESSVLRKLTRQTNAY
jgi:hypothetical protein